MRSLRGFAVLVLTFAAAALLLCALAAFPDRLLFDGGERYTFYVGNTSKNCRVVSCAAPKAGLTRLSLQGVCGESATYSSLNVEEFLKSVNGEIMFEEQMSDSVNYYCKADLPYSVNIKYSTINLHICVRDDGVTVASPIIFGGY